MTDVNAAADHATDVEDLFEHAPYAYVFSSLDGHLVRANQRASELTGYGLEQLVGMHVLELCAATPAGRDRAEQLFDRFQAGEAFRDEPLEIRRKDGSSVVLRLSQQPAFDADGRLVGSRGVLVDVADRQPDGAGWFAGDNLQAAALASIGNAVLVTEVDGTIVWVNHAFTTMSGYTAEEAIGSNPRLLRSGVHGPEHYEQLWATIQDRRIWRGEVVERHKDGALYTVWQTITPILDANGEIRHFVAVHEDVTSLRASQARLQALFDHATDGILLVDDDAQILEANPAVGALSGYTVDELAGMMLAELIAAEAHSDYEDRWARFPAEQRGRGSLPIRRKDGGRVEIEYQSVASIAEGVHLVIARDVTEQRRAEAQQRFQAQLLEAVGDAVIATDLDGNVRYVNPAAERLYGWDEQELLGRNIAEVLLPPNDAGRLEQVLARVSDGEIWTRKLEERRYDGTTHTALVTIAPYLDESGRSAGSISVSSDISDLEHAQHLLARRAAQQAAVAELGQRAASTDDPRAVGERAREKAASLLDAAVTIDLVWSTELTESSVDSNQVRIDIGTAGALVVSGAGVVELASEDHEFLQALANVVHATVQRRTATSQLEYLATHDPMTGLANRSLFLDRLEHTRAACQRSGEGFAVLFLDLDGFKSVNDGLGHEAGNEVLQLVADRLSNVIRPSDTLARFGGDEFAVLCPEVTDEPGACAVADRLATTLKTGITTSRGTVIVTASTGIVLGDGDTDSGSLLSDADTAMYAAKAAGHNRTEVFNTRMREQAHHRFHLATIIQNALDHDRVEMHYQPIVELATRRIAGVEALARLRDDNGTLIVPEEFIPVAETTGLIDALGKRILLRACRDADDWIATNPDLTLAVNLSPRQLTDDTIPDTIDGILTANGVDPGSLWLEITESALLSGPSALTTMQQLRARGIHLALDDFGTGYSSLAHLRQMPVSMLKIDRSFVSGVHADIQDQALVTATIDLAHTFGLPTTAEGVETDDQLAALSRLGCDYFQGFLFSEPVPAPQITALLTAARLPR